MSILLADLFLTTVASSLTCRHPSIRTHCERLMRSVHIGRSRYSRRCLLKAPSRAIRRWIGGKAKGAVAGTRHLGVVHSSFLSDLCGYWSALSRVVKRLILLATDPEMMKQYGKLAGDGDDRTSLSSLTSTLSQPQSPSAQIGVLSEWAQDVLCSLYQHHAQIGISLSGDMQLRLALTGVPSARLQSYVTGCIAALSKPPWVFQRQDVGQRNQRPDSLDLLEQRHFWIALFGERLDLNVVLSDPGGDRFKRT